MQKLLFIFLVTLISCNEQSADKSNTENQKQTVSEKPAEKPAEVAPAATLTLTPLATEGNLGQVTFTQNSKTVFYYDAKTKKGKINLNNREYILDQFAFDSKTNMYKLSSSAVTISTGACTFKENDGSDCNYGSIKELTINSNGATLVLNDVDVQDCPNY